MTLTVRSGLVAVLMALGGSAMAGERQDSVQLVHIAEQFLQAQAAGLPGKVNVRIHMPAVRQLTLPTCAALDAFQPKGSRPWGKTTVGVNCLAPTKWTVYLPATVQVIGEYVATVSALKQGQVITADQLVVRSGDLGELPADVITDPAHAVGFTPIAGVAAGAALRRELLRAPRVIEQGQRIRLLVSGPGFSISSEGKALTHASAGQLVQVKTEGGDRKSVV